MGKMPKSEKGLIQSNIDIILRKVYQVIYMYIMYPNSMHDIMTHTRLLHDTKCQSRTRDIIQPNIDRILTKFNKVMYTLDTICMPNITIISQAVL